VLKMQMGVPYSVEMTPNIVLVTAVCILVCVIQLLGITCSFEM